MVGNYKHEGVTIERNLSHRPTPSNGYKPISNLNVILEQMEGKRPKLEDLGTVILDILQTTL